MEATRLCPYCLQPLPGAVQSCPHCGKSFAGRNPGGTLPVGTVLAGRYTVGEVLSIDGEGILYRGAENLGRFRVTIKEYLPITLTAERTAESTLRPKTGSELLFKTTRMDFADLYRSIQRITPANGLEAVLDVVEANNSVYAILENILIFIPINIFKQSVFITLTVSHLTEDSTIQGSNTFNGIAGTVDIISTIHRWIAIQIYILCSNLSVFKQLLSNLITNDKFTFAM